MYEQHWDEFIKHHCLRGPIHTIKLLEPRITFSIYDQPKDGFTEIFLSQLTLPGLNPISM